MLLYGSRSVIICLILISAFLEENNESSTAE